MDNADFLAFHNFALSEANCFFGSPFVYKGVTYTGIINDIELSTDLKEGGLLETLGTIIVVSLCVLPVAPIAGERIIIAGKPVRIEKVIKDEVTLTIHCKSAAN